MKFAQFFQCLALAPAGDVLSGKTGISAVDLSTAPPNNDLSFALLNGEKYKVSAPSREHFGYFQFLGRPYSFAYKSNTANEPNPKHVSPFLDFKDG